MLAAARRQLAQRSSQLNSMIAPARALSYTVHGDVIDTQSALRTSQVSSSTEFDGDVADYVAKEVSAYDRHQARITTPEERSRDQEQDYNSRVPATQCWGRAEAGGPPSQFEEVTLRSEQTVIHTAH